MKYDFTYSCGHAGTIELFGKESDRQLKIKSAERDICPDCAIAYAKNRMEEDISAGMPAIIGSDKQVAWAWRIRKTFLAEFDEFVRQAERVKPVEPAAKEVYEQNKKAVEEVKNAVISSHASASWWIENRDIGYRKMISAQLVAMKKEEEKAAVDSNVYAVTAKTESAVYPENQEHPGLVEVSVSDDKVTIRYERNETLRLLVRSVGYAWDKDHQVWSREITQFTGSAADRAAELGNALLRSGFSVIIYDAEIRKKAVAADFAPECHRWISKSGNGFVIRFPRGDEDLYKAARRIHGSKWSSPYVSVPVESCAELEDFADMLGFSVSAGARRLIDEFKSAEIKRVVPEAPKTEEPVYKLDEIMDAPSDVLCDLKDD